MASSETSEERVYGENRNETETETKMESKNTEKLSSNFELPSQLQKMSFESKTDDTSVSIGKSHSAMAAEVTALKSEKLSPASPPGIKNPNVHPQHSEQELECAIDIPGLKNIPIKVLNTTAPKRPAPSSSKASPDTPKKRSPNMQDISGGQQSRLVADYERKLRSPTKNKNLIKSSTAERTTRKKVSSDKRFSSKNEIPETNESVFTEIGPGSELSTHLQEGYSQSSTTVPLMKNVDTHSSTTPRRKPQSTKRKLTATNQIKSPMCSETSMKVTRSTFRRVTRSKAAALGKPSKIVYESKVSAKKTSSRRADLGSLKQKSKTEIFRRHTEGIGDKPSTIRVSASSLSQNATNVAEEKKDDDSDIIGLMASSSISNVSYVSEIQNAILPKDKSPNIVDPFSQIYHAKGYNTKNTEELKTRPYKQTPVSEIKSDIYVQSYSRSNEEPDKMSSTLQEIVSKKNSNVLSVETITDFSGESEIKKIALSKENTINIGHQSTDSSSPEDYNSLNMKELKKFVDKKLPSSYVTSELCVESEPKSNEMSEMSSEDLSKNNIPSNVLQQETINDIEIVSEAVLMESKCVENKQTSDGNVSEILIRIPEIKITELDDETDNSTIETKFDNVSGSSRAPAISVIESNISKVLVTDSDCYPTLKNDFLVDEMPRSSGRTPTTLAGNLAALGPTEPVVTCSLESTGTSIPEPENSSIHDSDEMGYVNTRESIRAESCISDNTKDIPRLQFEEREPESSTSSIRPENSSLSSSDNSSEPFYQLSQNETLLSERRHTQINVDEFDFLGPMPANCQLDDILIETQRYLKGEQTLINKEIMETSSSPTSSSSETSSTHS